MGENLWAEFDKTFEVGSFEESLKLIRILTEKKTLNSEVGRSARRLAELHAKNPKDQAKHKAVGYAFLSAASFAEDGRFAAAAEGLEWMRALPASQKYVEYLEAKISSTFSAPSTKEIPASSPPPTTSPTPLISELSSAHVERLLALASSKTLAAEEVLFREGDAPEHFYIIAEGEMKLNSRRGFEKTLKEGEFFGEVAVLGGSPARTATLTAGDQPVRLMEFSKLKLIEAFLAVPELEQAVLKFYSRRLFQRMVPENSFLSTLSPKQCLRFFSSCRFERVRPHTSCIQAGEKDRQIFLILSGIFEVKAVNGSLLAELGAGEFFGELGAVLHEDRSATVTSRTPADLLVVPNAEVPTLLKDIPELRAWLFAKGDERRSPLEHWKVDD